MWRRMSFQVFHATGNDIGLIAVAGSGLTAYNRAVAYCQAVKAANPAVQLSLSTCSLV